MPSKSNNIFTRIKENVMGTKEENAQAEKDIAKYKASKEKEKYAEMGMPEKKKAAEEFNLHKTVKKAAEKEDTKMAKGGAVKKATVKKASAKTVKKPTIAVMIAVGKPKMNKGGMSKKKC